MTVNFAMFDGGNNRLLRKIETGLLRTVAAGPQ
jgi:hypothetical protein